MKTTKPKQTKRAYRVGDKVVVDKGSFKMSTWIDRIYQEKGETMVDTRDGGRVYLHQVLRLADPWGVIGE